MDFTREPIIETVITPKEGCKLVVRSSKSTGQEEYFVDAVEVVSFGHSFFFRSLERPKTFFVPATDYEILEVRETRMVLKNVGIDRAIKIGGGREGQMRTPREAAGEKEAVAAVHLPEPVTETEPMEEKPQDGRVDKKRERRRNYRKRRGRETGPNGEDKTENGESINLDDSLARSSGEEANSSLTQQVATTSILTSLLPPPPMLISETIARYYKGNALYDSAFYTKTEPKVHESIPEVELKQPEYGSFEMSDQEEEEVYRLRKKQAEENENSLSENGPESSNSPEDSPKTQLEVNEEPNPLSETMNEPPSDAGV